MSLKCQGDLIVAANVDKSEVIYTLIEPFHPFEIFCHRFMQFHPPLHSLNRGGFWERGALQKLRRLTACRMCSKHDRRLAQSGSAIMSKAAQAQNAKLLGEVVLRRAMHFSKSWFWCIEMNERCFVPRKNWCSHRTHAEEKFLMLSKWKKSESNLGRI